MHTDNQIVMKFTLPCQRPENSSESCDGNGSLVNALALISDMRLYGCQWSRKRLGKESETRTEEAEETKTNVSFD